MDNDEKQRRLAEMGLGPRSVHVPGVGDFGVSMQSPLPKHLSVLLDTDDRQKFWMSRATWPLDAFGKVFLGRAVHRVGEAMFPGKWTGFEPEVTLTLQPLPSSALLASNIQVWDAEKLSPGVRPKHNTLNEEAWRRARSTRQASIDATAPARDRLLAVQEALRETFVGGTLLTSLLALNGGEFTSPVKVSDWNTPLIPQRFYRCQMHPLRPLQLGVFGDGYHWIFVDGAQLDQLLGAIREAAREPSGPKVKPDDAAIEKMLVLIDSNAENSAWSAAWTVADGLSGASREATRQRLFRKFKRAYPGKVQPRAPSDA